MIGRRDFITLLGATAAWPVAARAQRSALPVIGFLSAGAENNDPRFVPAFRHGLSEQDLVEGREATRRTRSLVMQT